MKNIDHEIFLEAAERLDSAGYGYCCLVINGICSRKAGTTQMFGSPCQYREERFFASLFNPEGNLGAWMVDGEARVKIYDRLGTWCGGEYRTAELAQEAKENAHRILALLLAAEIARTSKEEFVG